MSPFDGESFLAKVLFLIFATFMVCLIKTKQGMAKINTGDVSTQLVFTEHVLGKK